ncbi:MAG TPA: hypothetical protein VGV35_15520, partial [Bryobacteraceae bacterium]|nr:hypothetical protein [Bryobacteraceae bacterium]
MLNRATALFLAMTTLSYAATAVLNDGGGAVTGHSNFDDAGWQFTNASTINVTALGLFANGGLTSAHQV